MPHEWYHSIRNQILSHKKLKSILMGTNPNVLLGQAAGNIAARGEDFVDEDDVICLGEFRSNSASQQITESNAASHGNIMNAKSSSKTSALVNHRLLEAHKETIKASIVREWAAAQGYNVEAATSAISNWNTLHRRSFEADVYAELNLAEGATQGMIQESDSVSRSASTRRKRNASESSGSSSTSQGSLVLRVPKKRYRFTNEEENIILAKVETAFSELKMTVKNVCHKNFAALILQENPTWKHTNGSVAKHIERTLIASVTSLHREHCK
uniref:Homeobox domain-containing protein n=1 Tax=Panagrellus redivivus TaxID=6233 RepID=A0A7E4UTI4_PANRE